MQRASGRPSRRLLLTPKRRLTTVGRRIHWTSTRATMPRVGIARCTSAEQDSSRALHGLSRRGFVDVRRDYGPYLETSLEAEPDFPDADGRRSLWMGEVGIRLVLQRLASSAGNLEQLARLIAANERDERRELMPGSPARCSPVELGLTPRASETAPEGSVMPTDCGRSTSTVGPTLPRAGARFRGVRRSRSATPATWRRRSKRYAVVENGFVNWPPLAGQPLDAAPTARSACSGATARRGS